MPIRLPLVNPQWVYEGQEVWIAWDKEKNKHAPGRSTTGLRCVVRTAFGDAALIVNESRDFCKLLTYEHIWIENPHVRNPVDGPAAQTGGNQQGSPDKVGENIS